ncbi:MAG: NAD(P)-dependent oxidoreductase [Thiotrichales bacterium]|nr:NAD(P)-dependent oxidoreductase [Thiotrichales bacterium]
MGRRILITGSDGLIGRALRACLEARGDNVIGLDLRGSGREEGDVRNLRRVGDAIAGCRGVVHLAAVSRVVWGERDPETCWNTNVGGVRNVLDAASERARRPWLLFASSREVYGQPQHLPATEDAALRPINVYGRSKVGGERLVDAAKARGLRAATVRLSNVYGSVRDHPDRVVPAFARAVVSGNAIRMEGAECTFDFTHIEDTVRGMVALIDRLETGHAPPPIHLLTGVATTLRELAAMAMALAGGRTTVVEVPARSFDVSRFHGDPSRARELLGWEPRVVLRKGLERLVRDLRTEVGASQHQNATP